MENQMTEPDNDDMAEFDIPPEELLRRLAKAEPARLIDPPLNRPIRIDTTIGSVVFKDTHAQPQEPTFPAIKVTA